MSFSLLKFTNPTLDSDKLDHLSKLLLTPGQSPSSHFIHSLIDNELDVQFDATFNNDGKVTDIYTDKYDRLSKLLLTANQSSLSLPTCYLDNELSVDFEATFNDDDIVTDVYLVD